MIGLPCPSEIAEHSDGGCETSAVESNGILMWLSGAPSPVCLDAGRKSEALISK